MENIEQKKIYIPPKVEKIEFFTKPKEKSIEQQGAQIENNLAVFTGPKNPAELDLEKQSITKKFQEVSENPLLEIQLESRNLLNKKLEEEQTFKENEMKKFMDLNREKRRLTIKEIFSQDPNFHSFEENLGQGWKGKDAIMKKIKGNPEMVEKYIDFRNLKSEQLTLEVLPQLEKEIPGLDYYVTKGIATEMGSELDQQILIAVVEPSPELDPDKKQRKVILDKLIELGLTNNVALGEKFSGNSEKNAAFLDFVFIHKDKEGKYKSLRPQHEILGENEREVVVGNKLPDKLNKNNTFKEISPEDFSEPPSFPEHFRDDVIYNGIYLQGSDLKKKLDFYTNQGEFTAEQQEAINKGIISQKQFFTPKQAQEIKQTRIKDLKSMTRLCKAYLGKELFDKDTLKELSRKNIDEIDFDKILGHDSGAEIEKQTKKIELGKDKLPKIEDLSAKDSSAIFGNLLQESILGHGQGGKILKNDLFAFPAKVESAIPITILANQPQVIAATEQIEEILKEQGLSKSKEEIHTQVVEFMKKIISDFKGIDVNEYWGKFNTAELIRKAGK